MTTHLQVVVDIEGRAKYDNAVVTRIALCPFRFDEGYIPYDQLLDRTLYISINQDEQFRMGRITDDLTEGWWAQQSEELRKISYYPTDDDVPVKTMFAQCKAFLRRWNYDYQNSFLWGRNCHYEYGKLSSLNDMVHPGEKHVFNGWKWHECKTYNHILSGGETERWMPENVDDYGFVYHDARHDAAMDAYRLINLWHQQ